MAGPWAGAVEVEHNVAPLAGLRAALPKREILDLSALSGPARDAELSAALTSAAAVVLCLGETAEMSGEATSRTRLELDAEQTRLFDLAAQSGRPLIVLLFCGRPLTLPWLFARADAVIAAWFLGSEAGHGLADILTGRWNPSGRLSVSWPRAVGQIPIFYGQRPSGRPLGVDPKYCSRYIDSPNEPEFVFGHGLSYTRFEVWDLAVTPRELAVGTPVEVSVRLRNAGPCAGEETLLVFLRDPVANVSRPLLELRAFAKAYLEPGAETQLSWTLPEEAFRALDRELVKRVEPGVFEILVGPRAERDALLKTEVVVRERPQRV